MWKTDWLTDWQKTRPSIIIIKRSFALRHWFIIQVNHLIAATLKGMWVQTKVSETSSLNCTASWIVPWKCGCNQANKNISFSCLTQSQLCGNLTFPFINITLKRQPVTSRFTLNLQWTEKCEDSGLISIAVIHRFGYFRSCCLVVVSYCIFCPICDLLLKLLHFMNYYEAYVAAKEETFCGFSLGQYYSEMFR